MNSCTVDRPLDAAEQSYWLAKRVSSLNFVVFAELAGALDSLALRGALDPSKRANPLLRVRIAIEPEMPRFTPIEGQPVPLHEIRFAADDWRAPMECELATAFQPGAAPLMRCILAIDADAKRAVLEFTFHHAIADGRSGAALLRQILEDVLTGVPMAPGDDRA